MTGAMQTVNFTTNGRPPTTLHIETDGGIVNIRVGLTNTTAAR